MYKGSCHCGAIQFIVTTDNRDVLECDCSMCQKKALLHLIVDADSLEIVAGQDALSEYRFGTKVAKHYFCRHCGIHPFYVPRSHPSGFSVNFRCLDRYEELRNEFTLRPFGGAQWEQNIHQIR